MSYHTHLGLGLVTSEFFLVRMLGTLRLTGMSSAACFSSMTILVTGVSGTRGLLGLSGDTWRTPSTSVCVCVWVTYNEKNAMCLWCGGGVWLQCTVCLSQATSFSGYAQPYDSLVASILDLQYNFNYNNYLWQLVVLDSSFGLLICCRRGASKFLLLELGAQARRTPCHWSICLYVPTRKMIQACEPYCDVITSTIQTQKTKWLNTCGFTDEILKLPCTTYIYLSLI